MKKSILLLCCLCLLFSCRQRQQTPSEFIEVTFSVDDPAGQTRELFDHIDSIYVVQLHDNGRFLLSDHLNNIHFANDRIYASFGDSENKGLFVFDNFGNPLFQVGYQGRGPGEYVSMYDFLVTLDNILILDGDSERMLVYDDKGVYRRSWETSAVHAGAVDDETVAEYDGEGLLTLRDLKGKELRSFQLDVKGVINITRPCFEYHGKTLAFVEFIGNNVYHVTPEALVPYTHLSFGPWQVPSDFYDRFSVAGQPNDYTSVFHSTLSGGPNSQYGMLAGFTETAVWEIYSFTAEVFFPRRVFRNKETGRTLLLPLYFWEEVDYDEGFKALSIVGDGIDASKGDFFVMQLSHRNALAFIAEERIENPMLLRLQEEMKGMDLAWSENPMLLFFRLK